MLRIRYFLTAAALLVAPLAFAVNYNFIRDTAVARFNDADIKLHRAAIDEALATSEYGKPIEWSNERTGSSGSVIPNAGDRPECRNLVVVTRHKSRTDENERTVCKIKGQWKLVTGLSCLRPAVFPCGLTARLSSG